jgi:hypothetical protein
MWTLTCGAGRGGQPNHRSSGEAGTMRFETGPETATTELFDLDLRVVPAADRVAFPAATAFTACNQHTCNFSCTLTCTGATGRPCAC